MKQGGAPAPPAAFPPAAFPPALAHATAPAPRPARLLGAALVLHLVALGLLFVLLHKHRLAPAAAPQSIALIMQKPPPPPPIVQPKPTPKPPAPQAQTAAIPQPPPPPPQPPQPPQRTAGKPAPRAARTARATAPARALPGNPPPMVPQLTRAQGQQGWVLLDVQIGPDGNPQAATIAESSGYQLLDNRARTSVLQHWRFQPATLAGQPVASTIELWVSFGSSN